MNLEKKMIEMTHAVKQYTVEPVSTIYNTYFNSCTELLCIRASLQFFSTLMRGLINRR